MPEAHNVKFHGTGVKRLHHPVLGDLTLAFEAFELPADRQQINAYTAEPGSPSDEALNLLASWSSTPAEASTAQDEEGLRSKEMVRFRRARSG